MTRRLLAWIGAILYVAILIKIMVFKDMPLISVGHLKLSFGGTHEGMPNFIPFKTIVPYLQGYKGLIIASINILGNIILLIPIGFLIPLLSINTRWKKVILVAILSGLAIESLQVVLHVGIFDIDDVILNGIGVIMGYLVFLGLNTLIQTKKGKWFLLIISIVVFITSFIFTISYYTKYNRLPISIGKDIDIKPMVPNNSECCDLCGGTGGIGIIISKTNSGFYIKRKDGIKIHVSITQNTTIKSNKGIINLHELQIGDRVTLVGDAHQDNSFLADLVLVCQIQ